MEDRKKDHINLAFDSRTSFSGGAGSRLIYEPLMGRHPKESDLLREFAFLGKKMQFPLWVSSMTGGVSMAETINRNLAMACGEFGLGMGLGSCRVLLESSSRMTDFQVRQYMGDVVPLYMNIGIAQLEEMVQDASIDKLCELQNKLKADGLIIHVNLLQEYVQPEGDFISIPPYDTIVMALEGLQMPVIVKEVGQGFGPMSMKKLLELPIEGIEFAAAGGTNFSRLELMRSSNSLKEVDDCLVSLGHNAREMTQFANNLLLENPSFYKKNLIISGGIDNYKEAYELMHMSQYRSVFGMASSLLQRARGEYEELKNYIVRLMCGYRFLEQITVVK